MDRVTRQVVINALALLKVLGVTQRTVAAELGVTEGFVSQWKSGRRPLPVEHYVRLQRLVNEALKADFAQDSAWDPERKSPQGARRWRRHIDARSEAFDNHTASSAAWVERLLPGEGLANVYRTAEAGRAIAQARLGQDFRSMSASNAYGLSVILEDVAKHLRLLAMAKDLHDTEQTVFVRDRQGGAARISPRKREGKTDNAKSV